MTFKPIPVVFILGCILFSCNSPTPKSKEDTGDEVALTSAQTETKQINPNGKTIEERFNTPHSFERIITNSNTFAAYLRKLPLKEHGSDVLFYDGHLKTNYDVYEAVVDQEIGKRDLHQCADAVMRLRADYLRSEKRYSDIHFNFTNGFTADYANWMKGKRIEVKGNKVYWTTKGKAGDTDASYWKYLEMVFAYAGTLSLSKELKPVKVKDMQIGDVFIHGGSPGHAVLVIDMCFNPKTGEKLFMLAQSYMPAQQTQILKNNTDTHLSPWYSLDFGSELHTPEWAFDRYELKRF
jgi:hypothetical protein